MRIIIIMPKVSKTTTSPTAAATTAPVAKKAPKKVIDTPVAVVSDPVTVATPEVVDAIKTVDTKAEEKVGNLSNAYVDCISKLTNIRQQLSASIIEMRTLQRRSERELKAVQKAGNKRKQRNANRAPSGFVKPTLVSDQLAEFLGKEKGAMVARVDVTREINKYIRENSLQDPANGRKINPDQKLKKLLVLEPTDELTYFNLQRFMRHHFKKSTPEVVATVPAV